MTWLTIFRGSDADFWRHQTPRKLDALLEAYLGPRKQQKTPSLAAYLAGGDG